MLPKKKDNKNYNFSQPILGILDERYIILEPIDDGYTSIVYKVYDKITKEFRAAKIVKDNYFHMFSKEEEILKKINDYNLDSNIKLYDSGIGPLTLNKTTEKEKMYFILEYAEHGSLFDQFEKTSDGFSEIVCQYILYIIIKAVSDLHKKGICHRDIKLENILIVGNDYILKLCDFGFSTYFLDENNNKKKLEESLGTEHYYPPEILEGKYYDGEKVDIFCIGFLLFILMTKCYPFIEARIFEHITEKSQILYNLIIEKKIDEYWEIIEKNFSVKILSPEFKELFIQMVSYNPLERPSLEEIMNSKWMKKFRNVNQEYLDELRYKMISEMNKNEA